jgi:integrase/recombinase XerD
VADVVKEFILEREAKGMSKFYLSDLKIRLGRFSENFGDHIASEIESRDVDSWATELNVAAVTVGNYLRCVSALFSFAVRRGYSSINPAAAVEKPKVVKDAPEIFTPAQVDALLRSSPIESVPYFAIGVFAGLRPEEMKRLDWSQIDLEGRVIEVTGKQAKTNKRRLVDISPILLVWLRLHRRDSGAVTPSGIRRLRESAMKAAEIRSWPVDVLRHSFVSYSVARDQNVAKTALQAGHSVETLNQHYRNLVKPSDAVKFWRITPKPSKKECEQTKGIKKRG